MTDTDPIDFRVIFGVLNQQEIVLCQKIIIVIGILGIFRIESTYMKFGF